MTSKLVVNTIEADTGISSVSFGSSISLSSTSKFFFSNAGIDIGADTNINRPASGVLGFNINSSEKVRITSNGQLLIGHTASHAIDVNHEFKVQVSGTDFPTSGISQQRFQDGSSGATLALGHSRNGTQGSHTALQSDDEYGKIRFYGSDGTDFDGYGVGIVAKVDGAVGVNSTPGRLEFHTTASGSNDATEKLRIASDGKVTTLTTGLISHDFGTTSSTGAYLHFDLGANGANIGYMGPGNHLVTGAAVSDLAIRSGANLVFSSGGATERFRIASDGKFYFGDQTVLDPAFNNSVGVSGSGVLGFLSVSRNSDVPLVVGRTGTDGNLIRFFHAGVRDGVINTDSGGIGLYGNNSLVLGTGNATERLRFNSAGGVSISNTDSNAVHSMSNYDHGNLTYNHRSGRVLTSNGTGWDGNESNDGSDPILILGVTDRAGNSDIGDAYGLCLHSESQDDDDYGPLIGWSNRSNSGAYNTTYAAIVGQKTGQAADSNWSSGALHFFTNKPGGGGYMTNVADMTIDQAGHVMMPRNSRFYAISNSGSSDTNDGATGLISNQFETELVDSNSDFEPSNGRFTAPVDGKYEFHFAALHRTLNSGGGSGELTFYKNGSNLSQRSFGYSNIGSGGSNSDHQHLTIHGIFALSAGDYIDVRIHSITSGQDFYFHQGLGYFSGKLLG